MSQPVTLLSADALIQRESKATHFQGMRYVLESDFTTILATVRWAAQAQAWLAGTDALAHHATCAAYPLVQRGTCDCGLATLLAAVTPPEEQP